MAAPLRDILAMEMLIHLLTHAHSQSNVAPRNGYKLYQLKKETDTGHSEPILFQYQKAIVFVTLLGQWSLLIRRRRVTGSNRNIINDGNVEYNEAWQMLLKFSRTFFFFETS